MRIVVKRLIDHIEHLSDKDLMQVIDALVDTFEKRKAARLSRSQTPEEIVA